MPLIKIKTGLNIYYEQQGFGEDLVFISGLAADHTTWAPIIKTLKEKYRMLLFDNRDVGKTDSVNESYTIEHMARDTLALMDALEIEKATLIGHSMGGAIALYVALMHQERVKKIIVCASAPKLPTPSLVHVQSIIKLREHGLSPLLIFETTLPWLFGESFLKNGRLVSAVMRNILHNPKPQTLESFKNQAQASESIDLLNTMQKITTKTLVIAGKEDLITPLACSEKIHRSIRGSELFVIPDCGHMLQFEQPQILEKAIVDFIV